MSWAEIKKAVNSNINVPLNDYMHGESVMRYGTSGNSDITVDPGATLTIFQYSGKMLLYHFYRSTTFSGPWDFDLKFSVDGNDLFTYSNKNNGTNSYSCPLFFGTPLTLMFNTRPTICRYDVSTYNPQGTNARADINAQDITSEGSSMSNNVPIVYTLHENILVNSEMSVTIKNNHSTQSLILGTSDRNKYLMYGRPLE